MKKRKIMRLVACIMTLCLVWTTCLSGVRAASPYVASETATYIKDNGDYKISNILSKFQWFAFGDASTTNHINGAIIVRGKVSLDAWGDGSIAPSYIGNLQATGNFNITAASGVGDDKCNIIYYGTGGESYGNNNQMPYWVKNEGYVNLTEDGAEIQQKILAESQGLADKSKLLAAENNVVTIDCMGENDVYVKIKYSTFKNSNIMIKLKDVTDLDWFQRNICCISITDVTDSSVDLNFNGKIYLTSPKNEQKAMQNTLKDMMKESYSSVEVKLGGMNLVWNFPDATEAQTINPSYLSGHLVAPGAKVTMSTNYEGGVIANSIEATGGAEGHFYPMNLPLAGEDVEVGGTTATTTEKNTSTGSSTEKNTSTGSSTEKNTSVGSTTESNTKTEKDTPSKDTGNLEIVVQDEKTGDPVPNAKVEITYPDGRRDTATTDKNGKITKKGLEAGEYTVTVTEVPDGYTVATGKQDKVTVVAGKTVKHVAEVKSAAKKDTDDEDDEDDTDDTQTTQTKTDNAAKTGDPFQGAVSAVLLICAAAMMLILGYSKKRYE